MIPRRRRRVLRMPSGCAEWLELGDGLLSVREGEVVAIIATDLGASQVVLASGAALAVRMSAGELLASLELAERAAEERRIARELEAIEADMPTDEELDELDEIPIRRPSKSTTMTVRLPEGQERMARHRWQGYAGTPWRHVRLRAVQVAYLQSSGPEPVCTASMRSMSATDDEGEWRPWSPPVDVRVLSPDATYASVDEVVSGHELRLVSHVGDATVEVTWHWDELYDELPESPQGDA